MSRSTPRELATLLQTGDRSALARAVTLVESSREDHRRDANELLDILLAERAGTEPAIRVGISGTPGVGKSTFIEALGLRLVDRGHRVAVLAIDPSSSRTGGSILGDKTRMIELSRHPAVFIRPSPTHGTLGGVAERTDQTIQLVEAAGYDVVIVETVGVGQSETAVAEMTDLFVLLVAPAGGDDLQGIKRGVMELVDLVVVNKADGDLLASANHTAADYRHALSLLRPRRGTEPPAVLTCSALEGSGVEEVWAAVSDLWERLVQTKELPELRSLQARAALDRTVEETLLGHLIGQHDITTRHRALSDAVAAGERAPASAAAELAAAMLNRL